MKITVKDCLELDAFKQCIVAAGKRNLDNIVRTVSVMDAGDVKTAVKSNGVREQIVLTSFYAMAGNVKLQTQVIRELANAGIAALVLFHSNSELSSGNSEIIDSAEAMGLPLLIIAAGSEVEYADAIEQIMDKLLVGYNTKSNLINNTIYHLLDFDKHRSLPAALKEAAISNGFQAVLISKDFNPVLVVETRHRTTVADAIKLLKKNNGKALAEGGYSNMDIDGIAAYFGPVNVSDKKYFLLLVDNEDSYSAVEMTKLADIIELAMGMWRYTPVRDMKTELIKALIRGNKSLAYSLKDEMALEAENILSVFYAKGINGSDAEAIVDDFEMKTGFEVLRIIEGEETNGIIVKTSRAASSVSDKSVCIDFYDKVKEIGKSVRIFHSTGTDGIEGAADGFKLISETWTFVESVFPFKRVFSKYELVLVSDCIGIQVHGGHLKKNYFELLDAFDREMGENKAKQLIDTLETFVLDAGMNSNKTSQFMGIHTNTVQYRLKRINEVLGAEIMGNRVIPGLTIALALKRLERAVN